MSYATETMANALKAARQQKGLSQRALSKLAGVPQAHISKIESNAVDLRLSSLIALAHALDLELALVPRKAVPAVQSMARAAGISHVSSAASNDLARAIQAATRAQHALKLPELDRLSKQLAEISKMATQNIDGTAVQEIRKAIEAANVSESLKAFHDAIKITDSLRNALAHTVDLKALPSPRPAYRLEDDTDG